MIDVFDGFFKGKKVLVTGHTGFKGSWLCIWRHELGAEVVGVGLDPYSERDNFVLSGIPTIILKFRFILALLINFAALTISSNLYLILALFKI